MNQVEIYKNWKATLIEMFNREHADPVKKQMAISAIKSLKEFVKTCRDNPDFYEFAKSLPKIV